MPIIVHEISDGVFAPYPSGSPIMLTCRTEIVRVTRGGVIASEEARPCEPYEIEERAPPDPAFWVNHTDEELADRKLFRAEPFVTPEGKQTIGDRRFERGKDDVVREVYEVEDIPPPPPPPTRAEKVERLLDRFDLTREELLAELAGNEESKLADRR